MPRFCGGAAGYFGYDTVRHIEPCLGPAVKPFPAGMEGGTPDLMLMHVDELVIVDNLAGRIYLMVYADPAQPEAYSRAQQRLRPARAAATPGGNPVQPRQHADRGTARFQEGRLSGGRAPRQGTHRRRRSDAGPGRTSHRQALPRFAPLSTAPCGPSIPPLHTSGTSATSRSWAPRPRSWCARSASSTTAYRSPRSPSARWPAPASAAPRQEEDAALAAELKADPRKWPSTSC